MIFRRITLNNYRQYRDHEIVLEDKNLHVYIGIMGTGKSNLLNAINWCLYGDEPFLSKESADNDETRLNLRTLEESKPGEKKEISVKLDIEIEKNKYISFIKKEIYRIEKVNTQIKAIQIDHFLEVTDIDEEKNNKFIKDVDEVKSYVERFIPKKIRDYFFFEGENLEKYFKKKSTGQIRTAIEDISQVSLLEFVNDRFNYVSDNLRRQAGDKSEEIKNINNEIDENNSQLNEKRDRLKTCKEQIRVAEERIEELSEKLKQYPDVRGIRGTIEKLETENKETEEFFQNKKERKINLLYKSAPLIYLYNELKSIIKLVEQKKKTKEFPSTNDKNLIKSILSKNICICGRELKQDSEEYNIIEEILGNIEYTNDVLMDLNAMQVVIDNSLNDLKDYPKEIKDLSNEIKNLDDKLKELNNDIRKKNNIIRNHDEAVVVAWQNELEESRKLCNENHVRKGKLLKEIEDKENKIESLKRKLNKVMAKHKRFESINKKVRFLDKAAKIALNAKESIMNQIKNKIEVETNKNFFELMWKKESFKEVKISKDYEISLINKNDMNMIGVISGGETEVLALSFTLALQNISGFDAPIIIDRPFAMVSGPPKKAIAEILVTLAEKKQIILLLTPDDIDNIRFVFEEDHIKKSNMKLNEKDNTVKIEVI